jgi:hypothetical protein
MHLTLFLPLISLILNLSGPSDFYVLRQEGRKVLLNRYHVEQGSRLVESGQAGILDFDTERGQNASADLHVNNALLSPKGTWLAVLIQDLLIDAGKRHLYIVKMQSHEIVYRLSEEGYWSAGDVRWQSDDRLDFVRPDDDHAPDHWTNPRYTIHSLSGPQWAGTEHRTGRSNPAEVRQELLLTPLEKQRRAGAAKLLNYFGYEEPLRQESAGPLGLDYYLNGDEGAVSSDGGQVACVVFKGVAEWRLEDAVTHYRNTYAWLRKQKNAPKSGWVTSTVPLDLENEGYPHGVWFWHNWMIVRQEPYSKPSTLRFFQYRSTQPFAAIKGDVFLALP